jgi:hypothetical protein
MASPSSDDEEERSHPLAHERPGVYVQVMSPRRRKSRTSMPEASAEQSGVSKAPTEPSDAVRVLAVAEVLVPIQAQALGSLLESALDAQPQAQPVGPAAVEPSDSDRPSGEREIVTERPSGYARQRSENSNARGSDLVVVTLPPPPRLPSFLPPGFQAEPLARGGGMPPSLLDAPTSLRPQEHVAPRGRSWLVLAFVVALSAIIASALMVALRDSGDAEGNTSVTEQGVEQGAQPEPPVASTAVAKPTVQALAPAQVAPAPSAPALAPAGAHPAAIARPGAVPATNTAATSSAPLPRAASPAADLPAPRIAPAASANPAAASASNPARLAAANAAPAAAKPQAATSSAAAPGTTPVTRVESVEQPSELPENPYAD